MREAGKISPGPSISYRGQNYTHGEPYGGTASDASVSPTNASSRLAGIPVNSRKMIDSYYTYVTLSHPSLGLTRHSYFHKSHPFVLPQYYFLARLDSDPESLKFLSSIMQWIGSLFVEEVTSIELRETALNQLDLMVLPPNGFTVQTILLAAVAVHCEDEKDFARALLDRAIFLALEIRMNSREFANMERDPVLAESWRRTWWGLYVMDSCFAGLSQGPVFL